MAGNYILQGKEAREKINDGVELLDGVVSITLGPKGREVGFFSGGDMAVAIHDGVEVARRVVVEDPALYWAIRNVLQTANKQVSTVGDGTTVSIILTAAIYRAAMANIIAGQNPRSLVADLIKNRDILLEELAKHSKKLKDANQAISIATISAQDIKLGKQIGEIVYSMGIDGVVTQDTSDTGDTYVDLQEGCQFENGYISPYFVTDPVRMEATVENTRILLTDKVLNNINELLPLLDQFTKQNIANLVVIAPDVTDSALNSMILTKLRMNNEGSGMNLLAVRAPYGGQVQKDFLDDIAVMTGGVVISQQQGRRFDTVRLAELGIAKRVTATENSTQIVGGNGDKLAIEKRIHMLKEQREKPEGSDYQKEKIKERLAKLSTGIAVVKVGAPLEIEQKNYIERAKDAIRATTAALKDGFVPGGETIYLTIREKCDNTLGGRILYNALEQPYRVLLTNGGYAPDRYIDFMQAGNGMDVMDGKIKNMVEAGIVDPTAVPLESIKNAISSAIALFTTEILILPKKEEKPDGQK